MGIRLGLRPGQIPFRGNYRERGLRLLRADVTKTGIFSVENFFQTGLAIEFRSLAGGDVDRFGEAEGEPMPFFEANHGSGGPGLMNFAWRSFTVGTRRTTSIPAHEEAGRLNRQIRACEVDGIQSQADIAPIALDPGSPGRLHTTCDGGAARDQPVPLDDYRFVDDGLEGSIGAWILGGYRVLQPNREQCPRRQILGIVERKSGFRARAIVLIRLGAARRCAVMKWDLRLIRVRGTGITLQPGGTVASRRPEQR
jgi:hypothetical protein